MAPGKAKDIDMKKLIYIVVIVSFISCKMEKQPVENDTVVLTQFHWLEGNWQRVNDKEGLKTYEYWEQDVNQDYLAYSGIGFTLQEKDTVFKEDLQILFEDKHWNLVVTGVNENPTVFKIEEFTEDSFTAVNLQNEFPTHIRYSLENDTLKASVSKDSTAIGFHFIRL
ncbi:putative lipoprotein [Nonlabens dokdonensis DSW-6]|uniref:Putative lipoprotein n=1 Tax=Nonlabens dokdonensis (strain DSM 17205 / KCTC 12402 / DSW-6) TaxID=592029 RepID=L7W9L5_NONDD|nr:putative lipoprotein [Nonlabens dokdonensis DSW-6]